MCSSICSGNIGRKCSENYHPEKYIDLRAYHSTFGDSTY